MGCDGGSIPRREELVKLKKKAEKVDPTEVERIKWFTCALSTERLKEPIVACELGHLYNKEAVIRALIEKNIDEKFNHIRSLKDLITPRFTPNPAFNASSAETDTSASRTPFLCPITLVEVGHSPFAIIRTCGCVLSDRALREVPSPTCLQCGASFTSEDIIPLNPDKEGKEVLRARMEARRDGEKSKKKEKREKRREKKEGKVEKGGVGEKAENGVKENGHAKENGEKGEKKERKEKENGEKANGTKENGVLEQDKKGKKREIETSTSTSEPSTKSTKLNPSSSSSSSKRPTTTTTTSTTTYTPYVTPHGGEKDDVAEQPAHITVQKTAAYNSLFKSARPASNANKLFSGIY